MFLHKDWDVLVEKLIELGYNTYLSTKIPISEKIIKKLKDLGVKDIQISLETIINDNLQKLLKVPSSYQDKMIKTFDLMEKYGININVPSI